MNSINSRRFLQKFTLAFQCNIQAVFLVKWKLYLCSIRISIYLHRKCDTTQSKRFIMLCTGNRCSFVMEPMVPKALVLCQVCERWQSALNWRAKNCNFDENSPNKTRGPPAGPFDLSELHFWVSCNGASFKLLLFSGCLFRSAFYARRRGENNFGIKYMACRKSMQSGFVFLARNQILTKYDIFNVVLRSVFPFCFRVFFVNYISVRNQRKQQ